MPVYALERFSADGAPTSCAVAGSASMRLETAVAARVARVGRAGGGAGATATTTVTFIIPVFAILFGALVLEEKVTFRIGLGMLVVFAGAALTTKLLPRTVRS